MENNNNAVENNSSKSTSNANKNSNEKVTSRIISSNTNKSKEPKMTNSILNTQKAISSTKPTANSNANSQTTQIQQQMGSSQYVDNGYQNNAYNQQNYNNTNYNNDGYNNGYDDYYNNYNEQNYNDNYDYYNNNYPNNENNYYDNNEYYDNGYYDENGYQDNQMQNNFYNDDSIDVDEKDSYNKKKSKNDDSKTPKKKSVLKRILSLLFDLVIIVVVLVVGAGIYLHKAAGINALDLVKYDNAVLQSANLDIIAPEQFSQEDFASINTKLNAGNFDQSEKVVRFTNKQVASYIYAMYQNNQAYSLITINSNEIDLKDYGFEIVQLKFKNPEKSESKYADLYAVVKLNLKKLKNDNLKDFPKSLLKSTIPDIIYLNLACEIKRNGSTYQVVAGSTTFNELDEKESKTLYKAFKLLINLGELDEINKEISTNIVNTLISEKTSTTTFYQILKSKGALGYSFESDDTGKSNFVIYTVNPKEKHTITYTNDKDAINANVTEYDLTYNTITLKPIYANGYNFDGWYDTHNNLVETIDASILTDITLTARWSLVYYTITYDLSGGTVSGINPTTYTIESADITINNPTKIVNGEAVAFLGWTGTDLYEKTATLVIKNGSFGNKTFTARFEGEQAELKYVVAGKPITTTTTIGETVDFNTTFYPEELGMSGYTVSTWYTNSERTSVFDATTKITGDLTLYGSWSYITNNIHFYKYLNTFNSAVSGNSSLTLKSHSELLAYFDYVRFYNITNRNVKLFLPYVNGSYDELQEELSKAYYELIDEKTPYFQNGTTFAMNVGVDGLSFYALVFANDSSYWDNQATHVMDEDKQQTYDQIDYASIRNYTQVRANNFDNFKINNIPYSIEVSISEQLTWVLENGYKPICKRDSMAESVYNKAKAVLRKICDDSMTDVEKLSAIYEWLILNVQYDNKAYSESLSGQTADVLKQYNSWFAEGVFNNQVAVCEGIAKALLIMARIEGIPTIYVTGNNHAWNKVYINGNWYVVDATHGNVLLNSSNSEILTYSQFMITDAYKKNKTNDSIKYSPTQYTEFTAVTEYDYYSNATFEIDGETFDLQIDSRKEMFLLFKRIKSLSETFTTYKITFEITYTNENKNNIDAWFIAAASEAGLLVNIDGVDTTTTTAGKILRKYFIQNIAS